MMIAADYSHAVAYLDRTRLPAYVYFAEQASAQGVSREQDSQQRIYVRTSDGAVIAGEAPGGADVLHSRNVNGANPFGKRSFFKPSCYIPKSESLATWDGQAALRFELQPACKDSGGASELYADPRIFRPIAISGLINTDSNIGVAIEMRYTTIGQYTVPSSMRVHVIGHSWLFWVRERAQVDYTDYKFYQSLDFARRQASKP